MNQVFEILCSFFGLIVSLFCLIVWSIQELSILMEYWQKLTIIHGKDAILWHSLPIDEVTKQAQF